MAFWNRRQPKERAVADYPYSIGSFLEHVLTYGSLGYSGLPIQTSGKANEVSVSGGFAGLVEGAYKSNGVVFACELVRVKLFSEARLVFRKLVDGRPGELFSGTDGRSPAKRDLQLLRRPWPRGTTGDLLARALTDADFAGSAFFTRESNRIRRLRPDWVTIVLSGDYDEYDSEIVGYLYHPGGPNKGNEPTVFDVSQVAQFSPIPDPLAPWRGMSWLNPIISEIEADAQFTEHKKMLMRNGATPNMVLSGLPQSKELFDKWVELFKEKHEGPENAGKSLFLAGAVDVKVVGADLKSLDFKQVQGAGETRIAAAAGVPPVIVGLSEGLQAATYSNYGQARRSLADNTMWPLWRNFTGSLAPIITEPSDGELWIDAGDIPFLREDEKDAAEIISTQATSIRTLTDGGYEPSSVVDGVTSGDLMRLKHSGLVPVQLQPPGTTQPEPKTNGKVPPELMPAEMGAP